MVSPECGGETDQDPQRYLIIAGDARQAEDYRRRKGLSRRHTLYATVHSLRGLTLDDRWTIVHAGTWRQRKDLVRLFDLLTYCTVASNTEPHRDYDDA